MKYTSTKKDKEKGAGMHLLNMFDLRPDSPEVFFDRERPDYTFTLDGTTVGVEITYCLPSVILTKGDLNYEQAFSLLKLILKDCETDTNKLERSVGGVVYISVHDKVLHGLAHRHPNKNQVKQGIFKDFKKLFFEIISSDNKSEIDRCGESISRMSVYKCDFLKDIKILPGPHGGFAKPLNRNTIEHCIQAKDKKLEDYKQINNSIDEYWLQVHVPYSEIYDAESLRGLHIKSAFDRIYVTDWSGGCYCIK